MPNIEVPENATPGEMLRAVADWYDEHPELGMPSVKLAEHPRVQEYVDAFAERFGVTPDVVSDGHGGEYDRIRLDLCERDATTVPGSVTLSLFGPTRPQNANCGE